MSILHLALKTYMAYIYNQSLHRSRFLRAWTFALLTCRLTAFRPIRPMWCCFRPMWCHFSPMGSDVVISRTDYIDETRHVQALKKVQQQQTGLPWAKVCLAAVGATKVVFGVLLLFGLLFLQHWRPLWRHDTWILMIMRYFWAINQKWKMGECGLLFAVSWQPGFEKI